MSDNSDSDYENAIFYPVLLPCPTREDVPPNRENRLVVHYEKSDEGLKLLNKHQWGLGAVSHDSLKPRSSQPTEDWKEAAARLGMAGPERNLRNADGAREHSCIAEPRRNARGWRFRIRRFLSRVGSRARSVFSL
ncbi:hypothetical protein CDAR_620691 [Caerostris darwini]|uniref:Uncharacterized protein n=1 Tax=Caerostris darwini TaxID=1538125 RepID=A0AAV4NKU7_9ARAC|nr:hypothetical protein CDAR_620691 [Caerostris darwini]